jgi:uncharacterized membrane protein
MVWLIFIAAFLARLIGLNQSLWLDEATSVRTAHNLSYTQILQQFSPHDFHPPLYYWMLKAWTSIFGISEISARMPSVIFSLVAGYFVWRITADYFDRKQATIVLFAFLFNPLIVYYSQEARMYMMVTMFVAMASYFTLSFLKSKSTKSHLLGNITLGLCVATFYGSIFFIAALWGALLIRRKYRSIASLMPGVVVVLLVVAPLLFTQLQGSKAQLVAVPHWSLVLGKATFKNAALIPLKFATGRISLMPKLLFYGLSTVWLFFLGYLGIISFILYKQNKYYRLLLSSVILCLILGICASFFTPILQYFRFIYLLPILAVVGGLGATTRVQKGVLIAGLFLFSGIYLLNPAFHREDWKSLAAPLPQKPTVYMIPSSADPLLYYKPDAVVIPIQNLSHLSAPVVTVIPYVVDIFGVNYRKMLIDQKYELTSARSYRGVTIEIWKLSPHPIYSLNVQP